MYRKSIRTFSNIFFIVLPSLFSQLHLTRAKIFPNKGESCFPSVCTCQHINVCVYKCVKCEFEWHTQKQRESSYVSKKINGERYEWVRKFSLLIPLCRVSCSFFASAHSLSLIRAERYLCVPYQKLHKYKWMFVLRTLRTHRKTSGWNRFGKILLVCVFSFFINLHLCMYCGAFFFVT